MTYLRHQCTVAFTFFLLTFICMQASGALPGQQADGGSGRNIPSCHCCHGKVFLAFDRRFDLKPVFLLPSYIICNSDPAVRPAYALSFSFCTLSTATIAAARLRGPPGVPSI